MSLNLRIDGAALFRAPYQMKVFVNIGNKEGAFSPSKTKPPSLLLFFDEFSTVADALALLKDSVNNGQVEVPVLVEKEKPLALWLFFGTVSGWHRTTLAANLCSFFDFTEVR